MRTKLKNQVSGNTVEKTFRAGEKVRLIHGIQTQAFTFSLSPLFLQVDAAEMNKSANQFTYMEGDQCVSASSARLC